MNIQINYGSHQKPATLEDIIKHLDIYPYITLLVDGKEIELKNESFNKSLCTARLA